MEARTMEMGAVQAHLFNSTVKSSIKLGIPLGLFKKLALELGEKYRIPNPYHHIISMNPEKFREQFPDFATRLLPIVEETICFEPKICFEPTMDEGIKKPFIFRTSSNLFSSRRQYFTLRDEIAHLQKTNDNKYKVRMNIFLRDKNFNLTYNEVIKMNEKDCEIIFGALLNEEFHVGLTEINKFSLQKIHEKLIETNSIITTCSDLKIEYNHLLYALKTHELTPTQLLKTPIEDAKKIPGYLENFAPIGKEPKKRKTPKATPAAASPLSKQKKSDDSEDINPDRFLNQEYFGNIRYN